METWPLQLEKSFNDKLLENYKHFIEFIKKEKPNTIKGEFIKSIYITDNGYFT